MNTLQFYGKEFSRLLNILKNIEKKKHHPILHKVHKEYRISKKTLFYVKEYGSHANVLKTILKESFKILLLGSIISSLGGFAFEEIKTIFISITPLIILWPTLNDMVGDYGMIISSKFSTMLHEGKGKNKWWKIPELMKLFKQIIIISTLTAVISTVIALIISYFTTNIFDNILAYKIFLISIIDTVILVTALFFIAVYAGLYFYKKEEDPNNLLIPITTSVADFGNTVLLAGLIILIF